MIRFLLIPILIVAAAVGFYARARGRGVLAWGVAALVAEIAVAIGLFTVAAADLYGVAAESNLIGLFFLPVLLGGGGTALLLRLLPQR